MIAHVNGVDLYYEMTGTGRPLVMVHGNGEDHSIFSEAARVLAGQFTCCLPDLRGHGMSTPVREYHYEDMAADIIALMEHLSLEDAVFCGFSDGGIIGLLAARTCRRIGTLIVCGANLSPGGIQWHWLALFWLEWLLRRDPKTAMMLREPHITGEDLRAIAAPTLVVAGGRDLIRRSHTRRVAAGIPGAALRLLPGETHGSYIVHSEKIAALVRDFCRDAAQNSGGVP